MTAAVSERKWDHVTKITWTCDDEEMIFFQVSLTKALFLEKRKELLLFSSDMWSHDLIDLNLVVVSKWLKGNCNVFSMSHNVNVMVLWVYFNRLMSFTNLLFKYGDQNPYWKGVITLCQSHLFLYRCLYLLFI